MDANWLLVSSSLSIDCPHCGNSEDDDYEVIPSNSVQLMHCVECDADFHLALKECGACGSEALFTWKQQPAEIAVFGLVCPACQQRYVHDEVLAVQSPFDE